MLRDDIIEYSLDTHHSEEQGKVIRKKIYKKRSTCVEPVFGNIKANLWFERFLLRWFEWVQTEWNLISIAHNLKKIIKFKLS